MKAKTYKNYLVQTVADGGGWTYGVFPTFEKAHDFIQNIILPEKTVLEIFGTDDDPDTYLTGETIIYYDTTTGGFILPVNLRVFKLAKRIYKYEKANAWAEDDADTLAGITDRLQNKDDLLDIIEYLITELETMQD